MSPALVVAPLQQRSADLLDRLVAAAESLFATRAYHEIRVADIAQAAGVSVGIVYTRFATKEHLLLHCAERLTATLDRGVERVVRSRGRLLSTQTVADRYFVYAARSFVRHRAVLRPVSLLVRSPEHAALQPLVAHFNTRAHGALHDALDQALRRDGYSVSSAQIHLAIETASALLRERVLYRDVCDSAAKATKEARIAARVCVAVLRAHQT